MNMNQWIRAAGRGLSRAEFSVSDTDAADYAKVVGCTLAEAKATLSGPAPPPGTAHAGAGTGGSPPQQSVAQRMNQFIRRKARG
jgi:hypothetical protein